MANILDKPRKNATLEETARVDMRLNKLELDTLCNSSGEVHLESKTGAQIIAFSTPCYFGGVRWWYRCRTCGKGRMILYYIKSKNLFVCRNCTNAVHRSSKESKGDRAISTRWKILKTYGLSEQGFDALRPLAMYDRPKGIHRKTWAKVCERYNKTYTREPAFAQAFYAFNRRETDLHSSILVARRQYLRRLHRAQYMRQYRTRKRQEKQCHELMLN